MGTSEIVMSSYLYIPLRYFQHVNLFQSWSLALSFFLFSDFSLLWDLSCHQSFSPMFCLSEMCLAENGCSFLSFLMFEENVDTFVIVLMYNQQIQVKQMTNFAFPNDNEGKEGGGFQIDLYNYYLKRVFKFDKSVPQSFLEG